LSIIIIVTSDWQIATNVCDYDCFATHCRTFFTTKI